VRPVSTWRRLRLALAALATVLVAGTVGYRAFGLSWLDAVYQTVTTVATVGFRELQTFSAGEKVFTVVLILVGVGTALYAFTVVVETLIEGHLGDLVGRRRMERDIARLEGHVVLCGWGRVGRVIARELAAAGRPLVVIDRDEGRLLDVAHLKIVGDATSDEVLRRAGIERASTLVAALTTDADNLFVTLSGRALAPDLFIVARAREEHSVAKLTRAGADRVVNPQELGGARMAAFVVQPNVAEFVDVVMHEAELDLRLAEVVVPGGSALAGQMLGDAGLRERTGTLVVALRHPNGIFVANPDRDAVLEAGYVIIALGTDSGLQALQQAVGSAA
jgi:voltage-gated potassium channel